VSMVHMNRKEVFFASLSSLAAVFPLLASVDGMTGVRDCIHNFG
jgi:hypothetical protein